MDVMVNKKSNKILGGKPIPDNVHTIPLVNVSFHLATFDFGEYMFDQILIQVESYAI